MLAFGSPVPESFALNEVELDKREPVWYSYGVQGYMARHKLRWPYVWNYVER